MTAVNKSNSATEKGFEGTSVSWSHSTSRCNGTASTGTEQSAPHDPNLLQTPELSSFNTRLRACRSFLLTPASRPDLFSVAGGAGGDALILDLESTVAPVDKQRAREAALAFLRQPTETDSVRILRINSPRSAEGLRDLLALYEAASCPDAIIIPKCRSADEVRMVADILDRSQSGIGIIPMIELARAVFVANLIAEADRRVCGVFLGGGDLAADLGAVGSWENLLFARSQVVAAAATTGIASIDAPYFKSDSEGLHREAEASRRLGMTGKAALHAEQLAAIDAAFTPSPDAVADARSVIAAGASAGTDLPVLNGHVVEPAMIREAMRVLTITDRLRSSSGAPAC
ncbi:CoA ester lyase [Mesorhizobium sp. SARCC-RB16n]|uniref:HpcH/HpaI aldolase/citrate lyase family protein n=1 Tax=Mesorhizobium sp. SARCC-RB16n TaxID=2116687 RepID=UPI00122F59F4|nr:CoA ester lyase [Mesorhizobium sp. SARCC-RB16n]KAA3451567.1 CoA ester lyase [Mesorhizobium sp. SARCC-RB16n]